MENMGSQGSHVDHEKLLHNRTSHHVHLTPYNSFYMYNMTNFGLIISRSIELRSWYYLLHRVSQLVRVVHLPETCPRLKISEGFIFMERY